MPVLQGNVSGSVSTVAFDNLPCKIISGYLTNRTGGSIILNVYIATPTGDRAIIPVDTTLVSGTMYIINEQIILLKGYYLLIVTNGSLDYYFSIEP